MKVRHYRLTYRDCAELRNQRRRRRFNLVAVLIAMFIALGVIGVVLYGATPLIWTVLR